MFQQQVRIINTVLMATDATCIILAGYGAFFIRKYIMPGTIKMTNEIFVISVLLVMIINNYSMAKQYMYADKKLPSFKQLIWPIFKSIVISFAFLSVGIVLFKQIQYSRSFLVMFALLSYGFILIQRIVAYFIIATQSKSSYGVHKILIVGSKDRAQFVSDIFEKQLSWGHEIVGRLSLVPEFVQCPDCIGTVKNLSRVLRDREVDEVVFAFDGNKSIDLSEHLLTCRKMGIKVRILPSLWSKGEHRVSFEHCQGVPFITIKSDNFNASGLLYKRILDIVGGTVGTILFLCIYPIVGIAIKFETKGPVLFKQKRVGQNGRVFNLYKFRSMYCDAEERKTELVAQNQMNGAMFKIPDDPRITKIGKWLRKLSLDEFPQFINVLKGEMGLVGTRPPTIDEVQVYKPEHLRRISAKPGITGLWQISGRNEIKDFEQIVLLDCKYLEHWRFSDDIVILLKTIFVVLRRKGAF